MIIFKGIHSKAIILSCIQWHVASPLSYRQFEEMVQERVVSVERATITRWMLKYRPQIEATIDQAVAQVIA